MPVVFDVVLVWICDDVLGLPERLAADRLIRAAALDPIAVRLSPQQAYAQLKTSGPPDKVVLEMFDGRPVYTFRLGEDEKTVYADDGQEQADFPPEITLRVASAWARQSSDMAKMRELSEEDQWTVAGEFRDLEPIRRYAWPDGEQVYVSTVTGKVVQYTTRAARVGAYLGAIPHWLYFTRLRKHARPWSRLVIWSSGLGAVLAILGMVIGIWIYSPSKRYRYAGGLQYSLRGAEALAFDFRIEFRSIRLYVGFQRHTLDGPFSSGTGREFG